MATTAPWRNRIVGSEHVDPSSLLANPNNWRTHPGAQRNALRGSLDAMEIDPRYVAVAIKRWEQFTGKVAERIDG